MPILLQVLSKGIREEIKKKSLRHIKARLILVAHVVMDAFVHVKSAALLFLTWVYSYQSQILAGFMLVVKTAFIVAGAIIVSPLMPDISQLFSSESSRTLSRKRNVTPIGWIRIGIVNNNITSLSFVDQLLQTSDSRSAPSIDSPVVPSTGAIVTVKNPVNLRRNRPQIYNKSDLPPKVGLLKPEEKLIILKIQRLLNSSSQIEVWAQVGKCNKACN